MEILDTASSFENTISFSEAEVAVVKTALKTKLFVKTESVEIRAAKYKALVDGLCVAFGIAPLTLAVDPHKDFGYHVWQPETNTLRINVRFSLTNTLAGFADALAYRKPELWQQAAAAEGTGASTFGTLQFALSMFKAAAPAMFEEAKRMGRLSGVSVPVAASSSEDLGDDNGDDDSYSDDDSGDDAPVDHRPVPPRSGSADIDPENRRGTDEDPHGA
jgi:hypothetical protein